MLLVVKLLMGVIELEEKQQRTTTSNTVLILRYRRINDRKYGTIFTPLDHVAICVNSQALIPFCDEAT